MRLGCVAFLVASGKEGAATVTRMAQEETLFVARGIMFAGMAVKQGGGSSSFGRKSWKRRYFRLDSNGLQYFVSVCNAAAAEPLQARARWCALILMCRCRVGRRRAKGRMRHCGSEGRQRSERSQSKWLSPRCADAQSRTAHVDRYAIGALEVASSDLKGDLESIDTQNATSNYPAVSLQLVIEESLAMYLRIA
jgi:hypothetical protein